VGSYNRVTAACCGRGQELMQPVLDQFASETLEEEGGGGGGGGDEKGRRLAPLSCEEAVRVVKEAFLSGAEREISIGDEVEIVVIRRGQKRPTVERLVLPRH
jgi:20S proteasome alpha/beta subunit